MNPDPVLPNGTIVEIKGHDLKYIVDDQAYQYDAMLAAKAAAYMQERIEKELCASMFDNEGRAYMQRKPADVVIEAPAPTRFKTIRIEA